MFKDMFKNTFKKVLPFAASAVATKPMHSGEIYYLWEAVTSGLNLVSLVETYMMNTSDSELHIFLQSLVKGNDLTRLKPIENILKEEGFTVPPRPSSKTLQGTPGAGQEIKLDDDEVIRDLIAWGQVLLKHDIRAVGAASRASVRKVFIDLVFNDILMYNQLLALGKKRQVLFTAPPATARDNTLDMAEVATLWGELGARDISIVNLETYIANTKDPELIKILKTGLNDVVMPQLKKIEDLLKQEGFTVPARPPKRLIQGPPGQVNKIILNDGEIIRILVSAMQVAMNHHIDSFTSAVRPDVGEMFTGFLKQEIKYFEQVFDMASGRNALNNPPVVTSRQG